MIGGNGGSLPANIEGIKKRSLCVGQHTTCAGPENGIRTGIGSQEFLRNKRRQPKSLIVRALDGQEPAFGDNFYTADKPEVVSNERWSANLFKTLLAG
jgi:hypothetical protein